MATVSDGKDPGRAAIPMRQSPGARRHGHGGEPDPTVQNGQLPAEIFGFHQSYSTGAPGSKGASAPAGDVTIQAGQLEEGLSGVSGDEITSTGLHGSQGARPHSGGETIVYTDPFGNLGNSNRNSSATGVVSGPGDWTAQGEDNGFSGPTLPALEGNRPTSTGIGKGHVHVKHPDAGA